MLGSSRVAGGGAAVPDPKGGVKPHSKKTELAIRLMAQACVLERMGASGMDESAAGKRNLQNLIGLLQAAAKSLDSKVRAVTL